MPFGEDIHRLVRQLRFVAGLIGLALAAVAALAAAGMVLRAARPAEGSFAAVVLAGVIALAALAGGVTALELSTRRAKKAGSLAAAAAAYKIGCIIAGGANFAAGCVTLIVVFTGGVSGGLWLPELLVLAMNLLGLGLAVPRVKHLRQIHYRPTLPVTRV